MPAARVSAIIPTKGRPAILMEALRSVAAQGAWVAEVIVVDGTRERADEAVLATALSGVPDPPRLVYCWAPEDSGLPAARNRGVSLARGEIVQFMDDDTTLEPGFFERLLPSFDRPEIGGVAGFLIDSVANSRPLRSWLFRCAYVGPFRQDKDELFIRTPEGLTLSNTLPGASAYRRAVFDEFRFDESLTGPAVGEDLDFSYRVGKKWRLAIQPAARMIHHRTEVERQASRRVFADKVAFFHYHFRKNMRGSPVEWLAYLWLNAAFVLDALARLQLAPIVGIADGWRRIGARGLLIRPPGAGHGRG